MHLLLPTGFDNARDFALQRHLTKMDAAQPKPSNIATWTPAGFAGVRVYKLAAIPHTNFVLSTPLTGYH
jgi:hypothetical protein